MNNEQHNKIEDILNSLDGHPKASMPPFFYTRLKARMSAAEEKTGQTSNQRSWMLRPAFAMAGLFTVLVVNAFVLFQRFNTADSSSDTDSIQSIAAEYSLNNDNSTALLDLNQDNK